MQKQISIGDILDQYGQDFIARNKIRGQEKGIVNLLSACRGQAMGSHFERCDNCNYLGKAYNSCRNRHCPTCQQKDKLQWLDKRMQELLPVGYYHLVFTIPHQLNPLCLNNKKVMYDLLFKAASQTLLELAKDTRHMGADTGLITVLHTWGQNMREHPHLHCIMPAGGLSFDKQHWVHADKKNNFFIHYKILSRKFRGKFLNLLKQAYSKGELVFKGSLIAIAGKRKFGDFTWKLSNIEWVVNIQAPLGKNPGKILEYLSRYVFRVAITDRRVIQVKDGKVRFRWKDYRTGLFREMSLDINEFIRRFLLHVLPRGFFKIRYHGIFANRYRRQNIDLALKYLNQEKKLDREEAFDDGCIQWEKQDTIWIEILKSIEKYRKPNCPECKKGRLHFAGIVPQKARAPG